MPSVLVVGCGSIGERHLRCFQQTGRVTVSGCDPSDELRTTIAQTYGVETVSDFNSALTPAIDAVVICTPPPLHIPMALAALRAGKHVLIEKPLASDFTGVAELLETEQSAAPCVSVAYVQHVYPFLQAARHFLNAGTLGPIKHVTFIGGGHFPTGRPAHTVHYSKTYYAQRSTGGGVIQDAITHPVNFVESVIGPTHTVYCDCAHQVLPEVTIEDTVNISTRHGDILVNYALNQFQAPSESTLQFHTARGSVKIEYHRQRWGVFYLGDTDWTWHQGAVPARDSHFQAQAHAFLDQIDGQPSRLCSLSAAVQTLRFNLAAIASADSNQRVACQDLFTHPLA
jgi:predicted dehydrogenase